MTKVRDGDSYIYQAAGGDYREAKGVTLMGGVSNIGFKLRDACETYPNDLVWDESIPVAPAGATPSFIMSRGNTAGAGWIEMSLSPWVENSEMTLGFKDIFEMPFRIYNMVTLTHRVAGQYIASTNAESRDDLAGLTPLPIPQPVEILNASQTTTTITVNFLPGTIHGFRIGEVVSVYGFVDNRLNVANATVATAPSDTQITLVGNDYAFTSLTIASTPGNGAAYVTRREMLGNARNAVAVVHGNATATNRRVYTRSQGGVARPTGTLAGSHHIATGTDAATAATVQPRADAWLPGLETNLMVSRDHVTLADRAPDANGQWTPRTRQTQVVPNPARLYEALQRARTTHGLCKVVGKIVSISKSGSTTATIELDRPHGLVVGNYAGFYGVRDTTNFPNQVAGLIVAATPTPNSLQVVFAGTPTTTSYGGFLWLAQGQQGLGGAVAQVAQSVQRVGNIVTLNGSASWAAPVVIGNLYELLGARDAANGADLALDGVYNVINVSGSVLTLEPVANQAPTGADIPLTNCGGGLIQRFGIRLHVMMVLDYEPMLVEFAFKGNPDAGEAPPVAALQQGTWAININANQAVQAAGAVAEDAATTAAPVIAGGVARTSEAPNTLVAGDAVRDTSTIAGAKTVAIGAPVSSAEVASAARTTSGNSGLISVPTGGSISGLINVTASAGTSPTLDLTLEETYDNGTTYHPIWQAPRITGNGAIIVPPMRMHGKRRWSWVVAGTSPSFTFSISTNQLSVDAPLVRRVFDRTANVLNGTLNATTAWVPITGCKDVTATVTLGAATTPGTYALQISQDGVNGVTVGTPTAGQANGTIQLTKPAGTIGDFARVICTAPATGQTGTHVTIEATS